MFRFALRQMFVFSTVAIVSHAALMLLMQLQLFKPGCACTKCYFLFWYPLARIPKANVCCGLFRIKHKITQQCEYVTV